MMKLLFVNSTSNLETMAPDYPGGLFYILSNIRKHFPKEVDYRFIYRDFFRELNEYDPDIVLISSMSYSYGVACTYAAAARKAGKPTVLGGCHITALPKSYSRNFDIGVVGEGERTIVELLAHYLEHNNAFDHRSLDNIRGLLFWRDGNQYATPPAEEIDNLDSLPLPDRSPILGTGHRPLLFTTRGCPYKCAYCAATALRKRVRYHSPEYVVADIRQALEMSRSRHILLYDDLFTVSKARIEGVIKELERQKLLGKLSFHVQTRANLLDEELASLLDRMGVTYASMGLDSGNDEVLSYLKGQGVTVADSYRAVSLFKKRGILTYASFIIGSPRETADQIMDTYRLIRDSDVTLFDVWLLTPLPGTTIWQEALARGLVSEDEDFDWERIRLQMTFALRQPVIMSETMSADELYGFLRRFQCLKIRIAHRFLATRHRWQYLREKRIGVIAKHVLSSIRTSLDPLSAR
jgi:radical SAM superfamily enzyme YgiQ (UPF0313 family)